MQLKIRKYKDSDRDKIRTLSYLTASGCNFSDSRLVADLLTDYYVIYEPRHLLIAEIENDVVGYLLGCFDTFRCRRIKRSRVVPKAVMKSICRKAIGWREVKYVALSFYLTLREEKNNFSLSEYPAHFHINVKEQARGMGIGSKLASNFLAMLSKGGIKGVHVRVRQNDKRANNFFRKLNFCRKCGYPILIADETGIRTSRTIIYAKSLG